MGKHTTIQKQRIQANEDSGKECTACACPPHNGSRAVTKPDANRKVQCHNLVKQSSAAHCASLHSFLIVCFEDKFHRSRHDKMTLQRNVCVCAHPFRPVCAAYFEFARAFWSDCSEFPRRPPPSKPLSPVSSSTLKRHLYLNFVSKSAPTTWTFLFVWSCGENCRMQSPQKSMRIEQAEVRGKKHGTSCK